jgi:hypothetical protein
MLKKTSRNDYQNAQETPKQGSRNKTPRNEGQHALNSRSPLVSRSAKRKVRVLEALGALNILVL